MWRACDGARPQRQSASGARVALGAMVARWWLDAGDEEVATGWWTLSNGMQKHCHLSLSLSLLLLLLALVLLSPLPLQLEPFAGSFACARCDSTRCDATRRDFCCCCCCCCCCCGAVFPGAVHPLVAALPSCVNSALYLTATRKGEVCVERRPRRPIKVQRTVHDPSNGLSEHVLFASNNCAPMCMSCPPC